jgi:hypothetical protein
MRQRSGNEHRRQPTSGLCGRAVSPVLPSPNQTSLSVQKAAPCGVDTVGPTFGRPGERTCHPGGIKRHDDNSGKEGL